MTTSTKQPRVRPLRPISVTPVSSVEPVDLRSFAQRYAEIVVRVAATPEEKAA